MSDTSVEQRYSFLQPYVQSSNGVSPQHHKSRSKSLAKTSLIPPNNGAPQNVFQNNANPIIFKLNNVGLDIVEKWILEFQVNNPEGVNDYGLTSSHYFIQHIDICIDGNSVIETIRHFDLYTRELINVPATEALNGVRPLAFNYEFDSGAAGKYLTGVRPTTSTLDAGQSQSYYLDFNCCLDLAGVNFNILNKYGKSRMEIRVYMNSVGGISTSSTVNPATNVQLLGINLYAYGYEIDQTERESQLKSIKDKGFNSLSTIHKSVIYPIAFPTSGADFNQVLMSMDGTLLDIRAFCTVNDPPPAGGGGMMYNYIPFTKINLLTQTGTSYLNTSLSTTLQGLIDSYNNKNGTLGNANADSTSGQFVWRVNLSPDPENANNGIPNGGTYISDWRIRGTFTAAGTGGQSYSLYVSALQCCYVSLDKTLNLSVTAF